MESNKTANRMHPLVAGAAVSVMVVSLTGVAAMTGMLPNSHGSITSPSGNSLGSSIGEAAAATSPAALLQGEPDREQADSVLPQAHGRLVDDSDAPPSSALAGTRRQNSAQPSTVAKAPAACRSCGHVESVQIIKQAAESSGIGMLAGAVLGGVLGNQIGDGSGRKIATVAGAVGGGYAGNEVEKRTRANTSYHVRVRMENGAVRTFPFTKQPSWSAGDRVRIVKGRLAARA